MTTFTMVIGLPASGKSTYANSLADVAVFSSDALRKELYGSEEIQCDNGALFNELTKRIINRLKTNQSAVLDATNMNSKKRKNLLKQLPKDITKKAVVFATTLEQCKFNNKQRDRFVPEIVIERMWKEFQFPIYSEGWNAIEIVYPFEFCTFPINIYCRNMWTFDQKNSHHKLTLGQHCWNAGTRFYDEVKMQAGFLHDAGKQHTQTFMKRNGTLDTDAHYYGHENVSAYESMFLLYGKENIIEELQLIQMHMLPYMMTEDKLIERAGNLYEKLMILHECDKFAH